MPCSDVTELITLSVDDSDRLRDYRFIKRTCGQGVGADRLLADVLCGKNIVDILAIQPEQWVEAHPADSDIEEFLGLKHLIAVQSALEVLTGRADTAPDSICAAGEIGYADGLTTLEARISVDLVTERIKACGSCKGCGKNTRKKKVVFY